MGQFLVQFISLGGSILSAIQQATFLALLMSLYHLPLMAADVPKLTMYALVIGNTHYVARPLSSPKLDAKLMGETLKSIGFSVSLATDLKDRKAFYDQIRAFYTGLPEGSVALIYYAGHGVQISGANYLIPTQMTFTSEQGVQRDAYALRAMLESLSQAKSAVNIVILDACRNNPFQPATSKYRNINAMGLAKVSAPKGTIVAYSTSPGQLALDGDNTNSIYTASLAEEMKKPGRPIELILKSVADKVRKKTIEDQQPWYESSLVDDFYFLPENGTRMIALRAPKKGNANLQSASRGVSLNGPQRQQEWYTQLTGQELAELDVQIQQRVKHLTEEEIPLLIKQANSGNVVAMTTLGIAYRDGVSKLVEFSSGKVFRAKSNNTKSISMLNKASSLGFPIAQVELGEMLMLGHGTDKDIDQAIILFEAAAMQGFKRAQIDLMQARFTKDPTNKEGIENALSELWSSKPFAP